MGGVKWWDGYSGQPFVIVDDYRRDLCTFSELLRLLDEYPYRVERKGSSCQFRATDIVITSPKHPRSTWEGRTSEEIGQLLRRIEHVGFFGSRGSDPIWEGDPNVAVVQTFNPSGQRDVVPGSTDAAGLSAGSDEQLLEDDDVPGAVALPDVVASSPLRSVAHSTALSLFALEEFGTQFSFRDRHEDSESDGRDSDAQFVSDDEHWVARGARSLI